MTYEVAFERPYSAICHRARPPQRALSEREAERGPAASLTHSHSHAPRARGLRGVLRKPSRVQHAVPPAPAIFFREYQMVCSTAITIDIRPNSAGSRMLAGKTPKLLRAPHRNQLTASGESYRASPGRSGRASCPSGAQSLHSSARMILSDFHGCTSLSLFYLICILSDLYIYLYLSLACVSTLRT